MKRNIRTSIIILVVSFVVIISLTIYEYIAYSRLTNNFVLNIVEEISSNYPDVAITDIIDIINSDDISYNNILENYGFTANDLNIIRVLEDNFYKQLIINIIVFIIISIIIIIVLYIENKKNKQELNNIINYLKELNRGNYSLKIASNKEGLLSILENEIYTTTIMLREKAEKELIDKQNLKDSLTNISHQLKTPLTSISLLVDNMLDGSISPKMQKEFLEDIKKQIESINYLTIVLLKLSRFDANVVTFKKELINVKELCLDVYEHIDVLRELKNVTIHITGDDNVSFIGDYKWEFEAISNILKNSLEYTPENKNIYINFRKTNFYTEITIKDEGSGMSKEDQKRIFERFFKGKNSSSNNFGIGMSLAKEIINKDNGQIKVKSIVGVGTTFKICYYK